MRRAPAVITADLDNESEGSLRRKVVAAAMFRQASSVVMHASSGHLLCSACMTHACRRMLLYVVFTHVHFPVISSWNTISMHACLYIYYAPSNRLGIQVLC